MYLPSTSRGAPAWAAAIDALTFVLNIFKVLNLREEINHGSIFIMIFVIVKEWAKRFKDQFSLHESIRYQILTPNFD